MTTPQNNPISIDEAETLLFAALSAAGASDDAATATARALVAAEAEGQVGHGFSRIGDYTAQLRSGKVKGDAVPHLSHPQPAALQVDAGYGFAYPALELVIPKGIEIAHELGCVSMAITHSHHCGALSVQVDKIARAGLIGIMMAHAPAAIAPWGATTPIFGTNPIAFSVPRTSGAPMVIDLSLSKVARGKVMHARKSGGTIPEGWALDTEGNPTTDPEKALAGSMLPIGEAKGTALALMVELLAATFTGATHSKDMSSFFSADGPPPDAGQFLMAIKPANGAAFLERTETLLTAIATLEGARLPGTRRITALEKTHQNGLTVAPQFLTEARKLAQVHP